MNKCQQVWSVTVGHAHKQQTEKLPAIIKTAVMHVLAWIHIKKNAGFVFVEVLTQSDICDFNLRASLWSRFDIYVFI